MRIFTFFILGSFFGRLAIAQVRPEDAALLKAKAPGISSGLESGRYESNKPLAPKFREPMVVAREPESLPVQKVEAAPAPRELPDIPMAVIRPRRTATENDN